jgi:transposase
MMEETGFAALIGIDWGDRAHHVVVWDVELGKQAECSIEQTPAALHGWIGSLLKRFGGRPLAIAVEQSRGALIYALMNYPQIVLYPINPKSLARYRDAFGPGGAKDDPTDADLLADLLRTHRDRLRPWKPDETGVRTLRLLVENRRSLVDQRTALTNRLQSRLKEYYPQALAWAGGLDTLQACDFLERWPELASVKTVTLCQLRTFYRKHSSPLSSERIAQRFAEIRAAVELTADAAIRAASMMFVRALAGQIRAVTTTIREYDDRIAALFAEHDDARIFASFPGAGGRLAPRLLTAFGSDRSRFEEALEVAQWSGVAPVLKRSGNTTIVQARRACPTFVKQTFHEYARLSIGQSVWARAYYEERCARGVDRQAIFRSLAYRWIRIMFACWKSRQPYDEKHYIEQLGRRTHHWPQKSRPDT